LSSAGDSTPERGLPNQPRSEAGRSESGARRRERARPSAGESTPERGRPERIRRRSSRTRAPKCDGRLERRGRCLRLRLGSPNGDRGGRSVPRGASAGHPCRASARRSCTPRAITMPVVERHQFLPPRSRVRSRAAASRDCQTPLIPDPRTTAKVTPKPGESTPANQPRSDF
jgi:hypothetical protein